jgi:radical SAM superfamily enzyme YgiQ (UPF0313 family)
VKIMLIRPRPPVETIGLQHVMVVEPLELEVIAATVADRHPTVIVDMILEPRPLEHHVRRLAPDLVGLTGYITHMGVIRDYCRRIKAIDPRIVTVAGGVHIEKHAADADCPWLDYRVTRNGAVAFPRLVEHLEGRRAEPPAGVLGAGEEPGTPPPLDFTFPLPRRDLCRRYWDRYFYVFHNRVAALKTSFGCPGRCSFCYCREITDGRYVERPLAEVLTELEGIEQSEIFIVDDNFLASPRRLARFVAGVRDRGIRKHYLCFGRADFITRHPDLVRDFRDIGLRTVIVGLESFHDDELARMRKNVNAAENERALGILRELGIDCYAAIILSPDWGREEFAHLRRTVSRLGILFANFQPLTPLPGTGIGGGDLPLLVARDRFAEWDLAHLVVRPSRMSVRDYYREIIRLYTSSVIHPLTICRHLRYPLRDVLRVARGAFRVWRQYRVKMEEAVRHG